MRQELLKALDELENRLRQRQDELFQYLIDHLQYHKENESKWGLVKIMRDHPFRTIAIGIILGIIIALLMNSEINDWVKILIRAM